MMYVTARQLEQLHRTTGAAVLPFEARLTPAAVDWARHHGIEIRRVAKVLADSTAHAMTSPIPVAPTLRAPYGWWSGVASGVAKAALLAVERERGLTPLSVAADDRDLSALAREVQSRVAAGTLAGAVVVVANAGLATVVLNRVGLRAIVGSTLVLTDAAIREASPHVLIIEADRWSLHELKRLVERFVTLPREHARLDALLAGVHP
jgi:hypothetical protein